MNVKAKNNPSQGALVMDGHFSRKEAASFIVGGCFHVHSHPADHVDRLAEITRNALKAEITPNYPWEPKITTSLPLTSSKDRNELLKQILKEEGNSRRDIREKIQLVYEELATNAIYHSYQSSGKDKYNRMAIANLSDAESVQVRFAWSRDGLYLSFQDQGGNLKASQIHDAFERCYSEANEKIETKEGGAGLGLYMVFEAVTHLKIDVIDNRATKVAVWISDNRAGEDIFSFNFFRSDR